MLELVADQGQELTEASNVFSNSSLVCKAKKSHLVAVGGGSSGAPLHGEKRLLSIRAEQGRTKTAACPWHA